MKLIKQLILKVGPFVSVTFENYDLLWIQIHEMLLIEKGGEAQIADEIEAYSPLLPSSSDLTFTMMLELDRPPEKRKEILTQLSNIEDQVQLRFGQTDKSSSMVISATNASGDGIERTSNGKTSAIHFLRFKFDDDQKLSQWNEFLSESVATSNENMHSATFSISHPQYYHSTTLPSDLLLQFKNHFSP
jgi:hypothetical protein